MPMPIVSAASERVFSTAGRLLEKRRTTLNPESTNALLFRARAGSLLYTRDVHGNGIPNGTENPMGM